MGQPTMPTAPTAPTGPVLPAGHMAPTDRRSPLFAPEVLGRAAYVVCLDRERARRVVLDALSSDATEPRLRMYAAAVRRVHPRPARHAPVELPWDLEVRRDDDGSTVHDALVRVVESATAQERAALAATVVEDRDPESAAAVLGVPLAEVQRTLSAVAERARAAHAEARAVIGLRPAEFAVERDLRTAVLRIARAAGPDLVDDSALAEHRRRRARVRGLRRGAAGAAVVLLVGAAGATAWRAAQSSTSLGPTPSTSASAPTAATTPSASASVDWFSPATWPARGGLATDAEVLRSLRSALGPQRRVIYAAEVPDVGRVAVLVDPSSPGLDVGVLAVTAPAGSVAWSETSVMKMSARVIAVVTPPSPSGQQQLVILTDPAGPPIKVSDTATVRADGTVDRRWATVPVANGIGVHRARSGSQTLLHDGMEPFAMMVTGDTPLQDDLPDVADLSPVARDLAITAWRDTASLVDVNPAKDRVQIDWSLRLSDAAASRLQDPNMSTDVHAVSISVVLGNGARLRSAYLYSGDGGYSQLVGEQGRPIAAGAPTPPLVLPLPDVSVSYLVVDPKGKTAAVAGRTVKPVPFVKGVATLQGMLDLGTGVVVTRADGSRTGPWLPQEASPLLDGPISP